MTTPAVSEDEQVVVDSHLYTKSCTGPVTLVTTVPKLRKRRTRNRPASLNNHRVRGWRSPSAWSSTADRTNPVPDILTEIHNYGACSGGNHQDQISEGGYGWNSTVSNLPNVPAWMASSAVSRALLELKNQDVNLAVAFAERKETEDLFVNSVKHIASGVSAYRRGHKKGVWSVIKGEGSRDGKGGFRRMPQDWLELQYGWNPLMSDVEGACNALSKRSDIPLFMRVHGNVKSNSVVNWLKSGPDGWKYQISDQIEQTCRVVLYYDLDNPAVVKFAQLGLTNPAELAWERLKYSFVIDWFLPVGRWLSTLDADFGWKFKAGSRTEFTRVKGRTVGILPNTGTTTLFRNISGEDYKYDGIKFNRAIYPSSPWAGVPSFKNPLSSKHIANALSLLVQAFSDNKSR
jgi:hypothetical protein